MAIRNGFQRGVRIRIRNLIKRSYEKSNAFEHCCFVRGSRIERRS